MKESRSLAKGICRNARVRSRGYGEVFAAKDKTSNAIVAVKVLKVPDERESIEKEVRLLKDCRSPYTVEYSDSSGYSGQYWVRHDITDHL